MEVSMWPFVAALERAPRTFLAIVYEGDDLLTQAMPPTRAVHMSE
jgi:hypothetical protein